LLTLAVGGVGTGGVRFGREPDNRRCVCLKIISFLFNIGERKCTKNQWRRLETQVNGDIQIDIPECRMWR